MLLEQDVLTQMLPPTRTEFNSILKLETVLELPYLRPFFTIFHLSMSLNSEHYKANRVPVIRLTNARI